MKIILCPKENGNTRKICDAIATEDDCELVRITGNEILDLSDYESVIVGSGVYGGFPHKNLLMFIRNLKEEHAPKKVRVLLTWLGRGKSDMEAFKRIEKEFLLKGVSVSTNYKKVLGHSFGVFHIGKPNDKDIKSCIEWANEP
ncbi:MAG: flavodoxin domain-containing protein [Sedimentibacter sp.]|uniref:flavodoxin family protein n=1 Tax=Sedimentibacter sp. TaxID=1960295 RepID=UPI002980A8DA|nr:flavodoxin domain-containing protein [Sedimentibacter sp.]MDW5299788.1 flavodoxin domain-containing protein [Sedimentibacter sp.]